MAVLAKVKSAVKNYALPVGGMLAGGGVLWWMFSRTPSDGGDAVVSQTAAPVVNYGYSGPSVSSYSVGSATPAATTTDTTSGDSSLVALLLAMFGGGGGGTTTPTTETETTTTPGDTSSSETTPVQEETPIGQLWTTTPSGDPYNGVWNVTDEQLAEHQADLAANTPGVAPMQVDGVWSVQEIPVLENGVWVTPSSRAAQITAASEPVAVAPVANQTYVAPAQESSVTQTAAPVVSSASPPVTQSTSAPTVSNSNAAVVETVQNVMPVSAAAAQGIDTSSQASFDASVEALRASGFGFARFTR